MEKRTLEDMRPIAIDWRSANDYMALVHSDRRGFAWEWLRRNADYRAAYEKRRVKPSTFGLLAYEDPRRSASNARPIWDPNIDPQVLHSHAANSSRRSKDMFDIRDFARFVSVEIDEALTEHWLLTNGQWTIRLALHDATLLGGPILLEHRLLGLKSAEPAIQALRQFASLAEKGELPRGLRPREARAERWILELRTADALADGATHQEMARSFFASSISESHWRIESASYRLRVQRLARMARRHLAAPLRGPWFH